MKAGKIPESVLKRSVLRQLKSKNDGLLKGAALGEDCAFFATYAEENMVSCMQQSVVEMADEKGFVAGTRISHVIVKSFNNLACAGATPIAIMIGLILPEETKEQQLKALVKEAEETVKTYGVEIAGGETSISDAVKAPVVTVTAYGKTAKDSLLRAGNGRAGMDIVLSKWIGLEGTAILAKKHREKLLTRYPTYLIDDAAEFDKLLSILPEAATAVKSGVCAMHDASKGGIFGALWEFAEAAGVGLTIDLKKIPLRQETVEVCELLEENPYELLSGGCLLMATFEGEKLVESLMNQGIYATIVGRTTDKKERVLMNEDEIRFMDRPRGDSLWE